MPLAHIVGKYNGEVFEDREVSFSMREGRLQDTPAQSTGFVRSLKTLEFLEFDFKALKVLAIGVWSLKVLDFLLNKIRKYQHL